MNYPEIPKMNYNDLAAEFDMMLRTLEIIKTLNTLGKTLKIDEEITAILKHYNRQ
jgi:hypothetical protein